jgi:hypothetical protein
MEGLKRNVPTPQQEQKRHHPSHCRHNFVHEIRERRRHIDTRHRKRSWNKQREQEYYEYLTVALSGKSF